MGMAPIWCLPRPFSKNLLFQKRSLKPTNFEHFKNIFFISGSNFIGLFNGTLFVFIISVVADTQKETFLPVRFNWPPLYVIYVSPNLKVKIVSMYSWGIHNLAKTLCAIFLLYSICNLAVTSLYLRQACSTLLDNKGKYSYGIPGQAKLIQEVPG